MKAFSQAKIPMAFPKPKSPWHTPNHALFKLLEIIHLAPSFYKHMNL